MTVEPAERLPPAVLPLVEARLTPPQPRGGVLPRRPLVRRLLARTEPLVTVTAPAGYGKTTTLALWRLRERRAVAWLTVDAGDQDPTRLLADLAVSIERAIGLDPADLEIFRTPGVSALSTAVPVLVSALHRAGRELVIMLDDAHLVARSAAVDAIGMLVDYAPAGVTLVLAGRDEVGLPLARFRANGRLHELTAADLALDEGESARLAALQGRRLDARQARELYERTEGWPAAVYLASRSGSRPAGGDRSSPDLVMAGAVGPDLGIGEYLDEELLDRMSPADRDLLLRSSILDRLTGDLCDALIDGSGSGEALRRLSATHQLVARLETRGEWYRCHALLREHLLARLEGDPDAVHRLHRRAADWHAARGMIETAIDHLFAAGEPDAAAAQATAVALATVREGRLRTLASWLERVDEAGLRRHPYLAVVGALSHALAGRIGEAEAMADIADGAEYGDRRPAGAESFEIARDCVRALMARRGFAAAQVDAARLGDGDPVTGPWRPVALLVRGLVLAVAGDERADAVLREAASAAELQRAARTQVTSAAWRTMLAVERDDWVAAEELAGEALATVSGYRYEPDATVVAAEVAAARVAIHHGDPADARRHMAGFQVTRAALGVAMPWYSVRCLLEAARVNLALADPAGARSCLQQAEDILRLRPGQGDLGAQVGALRARTRVLPPGPGGASTLTPAEARVLRLLPTYLSAAEMAERLIVTPNTVRTQIQAVYGKLGVSSRSEAVERAIELGLLEPLPVLSARKFTTS